MGQSLPALVTLIILSSAPQDTLTNASVEKLVKSGLSEDLIVNIVGTEPAHFDLSADALLSLKRSGVSDRIVKAMIARREEARSEELSSGVAKAGQPFSLVAAEDLLVNNKVVVSKRATATGRITGVTKKAFATRNGSLELTIDAVRGVDGQNIPLEGKIIEDGGAAGFGHMGKNVKVKRGSEVTAVVAAERDVDVKR
jgi:hypothetical protein